QGLFLAIFTGQSYAAVELLPAEDSVAFYGTGAMIALAFLVAGLVASIFHLGRPERAWRAASQWRTSWLSREVIALPTVMGLVFGYGMMHYLDWDTVLFTSTTGARLQLTLVVGALGAIATFALFLCTGMISAAIQFLQEWASPLTVINYLLLGTLSGFTLATAFASSTAPDLVQFFGVWTTLIASAALITRGASLIRNARIKVKSSIQTAIGIRHSQIRQKSMGFMGGSVNTRDFFHHRTRRFMKSIQWIFLVLVFPLPLIFLWSGIERHDTTLLLIAFGIQYLGLLAERWFFFAQANHPQNLYYQTI
ncbi:MAG TPA: DMSO reductase, partial [Chromatiales bacterium]|nr:DMSO reductase [Chromatiales bacterium]